MLLRRVEVAAAPVVLVRAGGAGGVRAGAQQRPGAPVGPDAGPGVPQERLPAGGSRGQVVVVEVVVAATDARRDAAHRQPSIE